MTSPQQPPREPPIPPPSPWWGVLMLLGLVAAVVALVVGGLYLWLGMAPREIKVPDVVGINVRAAEQILARRGLVGQITARRHHEELPPDAVISAAPEAGRTVRQGRTVELVLSDGPPSVAMPDVREMDLARASEAVSAADLRLARIRRRYNEAVPAGLVMQQHPAPDVRIPRGEGVELVVSAGPQPRVLPEEVAGEAPETPAQPHYAVVQVTLPAGQRPAEVRIEVEDERGMTIPYNALHDPGATITQVVTGQGEATARVYVDDKLIEEKRF